MGRAKLIRDLSIFHYFSPPPPRDRIASYPCGGATPSSILRHRPRLNVLNTHHYPTTLGQPGLNPPPDCLPRLNFLPQHGLARCPNFFVKKLLRSSVLPRTLHLVCLKSAAFRRKLSYNFAALVSREWNRSSCFKKKRDRYNFHDI